MVLRLFILLSLILLSSCKNTVTLKVAVWDGYIDEEVRTNFREVIGKKYNIEVTLETISPGSNENIGHIISNRSADIIQLPHFLFKDKRIKLPENILKLDTSLIDNYLFIEDSIKAQSFNQFGGEVYGSPLAKYLYRLAYNTKKVAPPDSWKILLKSSSKHNYILSNYHIESNIYLAALLSSDGKEVNLSNHSTYSESFLKVVNSLKENSKGFWDEVAPENLDSELSYSSVLGNSLVHGNSDWKFAQTKEGVIGSIDYFVLSKALSNDTLKMKIAYEWLNFTLSKYYQSQIIAGPVNDMPVVNNIESLLSSRQRIRNQIKGLEIHYPGARTSAEESWQRSIWE